MAKKLLISNDVFIDYLVGEPRAKEFFEQLPEGIFYYSALTKLELLSAEVCSDSNVRSATAAMLSLGKKAEIDDAIIGVAAELRRVHSLSLPDSVMAATALHLKAELVTKNVSALKKIKELLLMKPY
ncbi:PIN domain-containing protein [Candidatus Woesearchaeota archaeon]|nr:PIN domain-containing protein [Candidatus Woesearchaeota archaeon]